MKNTLLFIFSLLLIQVSGQANHDFGNLTETDLPFHDFELSSNQEKAYILRVESDPDVQVLLSSRAFAPNEPATLRVQINPQSKGRFSREIQVWVSNSDKALSFKIKGNARYEAASLDIPCPGFGKAPSGNPSLFVLELVLKDSLTEQVIPHQRIEVFLPSGESRSFRTNDQGVIEIQSKPGLHGFQVDRDEYFPLERMVYANPSRNKHVLRIYKPEPMASTQEDEPQEEPVLNTEPPIVEEPMEEVLQEGDPSPIEEEVLLVDSFPDLIEEPEVAVEEETPSQEEELIDSQGFEDESEAFPTALYRSQNLVFLLDVSGSMAKKDKLEQMQKAMDSLILALRPQDKISLITYADGVEVLAEGLSGADKDMLLSLVQSLEPGGITEEEAGLRAAYRLAWSNRIEDGNNLIFLFTDGVFDPDNKAKDRILFMGSKRGTKLSVGGIATSPYARGFLEEMARKGGGRYIDIREEIPGTSLIQEIQFQSKK